MIHRCLIAVLLLAAVGQCQKTPPFQTYNCYSPTTDPPICERVEYPQKKAWFIYREVEASMRDAHNGEAVTVINPWLRLGDLREEDAPGCHGNLKQCAAIEYTRNQDEKITKSSVRMRHWDLGIFCLAWAQVFEDRYQQKLTGEQFKAAVSRAIVNARNKISADALREER